MPAQDGTVTGESAEVQLPHGLLSFTVSDAAPAEAAQVTGADGTPDGEYVGVDWDWEAWGGVPDGLAGFLIADGAETRLTAEIDGETWDLGAPTDAGAVLLPADDGVRAEDVVLSVELDGVTQTVHGDGSERSAGRAAPLYDLAAQAERARYQPCSASLEPRRATGEPSCRAAIVRLPYVTGLGWAEEGSTWLVVDLETGVSTVELLGERLPATGQDDQLTVDGEAPEKVLTRQQRAGGVLRTQSVFEVPAETSQAVDFRRAVQTTGGAETGVEITGTVEEEAS